MLHDKRKMLRIMLICIVLFLSSAATAYAFGKGSKGPDVYAVQGMLKSLGYYHGPITGYFGNQTQSGVKAFQSRYGLPMTGNVDDQTLQSILWAYGNLKISKKPAPTPVPAPSPSVKPAPSSAPSPSAKPAPTSTPSPYVKPAPSPTPSPQVPRITHLTEEEQSMLDLVNKERTAAGLAPLKLDLQLTRTARLKSQDMVERHYFSHDSPTYGSPFKMLQQYGISYSSAAENISCNQSVEAAHEELMHASGRRINIMNKAHTHIGIGVVDGGPCGKMFTQQFISK